MTIGQLRIAYLPLYVSYYESVCPDFPAEKMAAARRCATVLAEHGELIWDGKLIVDADQAAAAGRTIAAGAPDCVVVFPSIAVFGGIPWAAIREIRAPVLIWNAQQIPTVGPGYNMVEIVRNTGQIGTQALANTLLREGRWFRVVTAWEGNPATGEALGRFFAVVRAVRALSGARLMAIGEPFPLMTDILIGAVDLRRLGATLTTISQEELTEAYHAVSKIEAPRERTEELSDDELRRSLRLSEAVTILAERARASAGTINCHGTCLRNPDIGVTACYSLGVQNRVGRPFTCTGDLPTALVLLALKAMTGIAMYTEVQVMDEVRHAMVIANSGEGEDGIRRKDCPAVIRGNTNFNGVHGRGASFAYPLEPGPATIASLTPSPTGFRLIVAEGEILDESLPDAGALAGFFRFRNGALHERYRCWLEAGAVHHAGTTTGHWSRELAGLAELLQFEFVGI